MFDGYREEFSTKDEEHLRRSRSAINVDVKVEDSIHVTFGQSEFLANSNNKEQLISLLTFHLKERGCNVLQAHGDADTLIVSSAIKEAQKGMEVRVISDDTDILVMLIALASPNYNLKMIVPGKGSHSNRIHNIQAMQQEIGEMKNILCLFISLQALILFPQYIGKAKRPHLKK